MELIISEVLEKITKWLISGGIGDKQCGGKNEKKLFTQNTCFDISCYFYGFLDNCTACMFFIFYYKIEHNNNSILWYII